MHTENEFSVLAPPDKVYAFLLDVNRVVACLPGAELSEVVDSATFKGRVRIRVGPVTVAYNGIARIVARDETNRSVTLEAEGRETAGPGSTRAKVDMSVVEVDGASVVSVVNDFTVVGRAATFGRGMMEEVSRSLVGRMAGCIKSNLEAAEPVASEPAGTAEPARAMQPVTSQAAPASAVSLLFGVMWGGIRRLLGRDR